MSLKTILHVRRGSADEKPHWSRFEIAFQPGESVLDGLRRVRAEQEPGLAFRYSCINANACKECMMAIDGKAAYACTTRLKPEEMRLEPLPSKALVRDLVTEIAPPDERLTPDKLPPAAMSIDR